MKRFLATLATGISLGCAPAHAYVATGYDWMSACVNGGNDAGVCFTYARGLADGLAMWMYSDQHTGSHTAPICIPGYVMTKELVVAGQNYFRTHYPETAKLDAGNLLKRAWTEVWPCRQPE